PVSGQEPSVSLNAGDTVRFEQRGDAARHDLDDGRTPLLHGGKIEFQSADLDAVRGEFVFGALVELGRLEQRLGRDATGVETGAAEGKTAVRVLPFIDAGDLQLVLPGANRRGITRGA